jgi:hypothetical protein
MQLYKTRRKWQRIAYGKVQKECEKIIVAREQGDTQQNLEKQEAEENRRLRRKCGE